MNLESYYKPKKLRYVDLTLLFFFSFCFIPSHQSVTATRWVLFMTGVTARATASVKKAPRGQNVTTVCRASTGNKAVTVSTETENLRLKNTGFQRRPGLPSPLLAHLPVFGLLLRE